MNLSVAPLVSNIQCRAAKLEVNFFSWSRTKHPTLNVASGGFGRWCGVEGTRLTGSLHSFLSDPQTNLTSSMSHRQSRRASLQRGSSNCICTDPTIFC